MTPSYSRPYVDPATSHKRTADWLVAARHGCLVDVLRFSSRDAAETWLATQGTGRQTASHPTDQPNETRP